MRKRDEILFDLNNAKKRVKELEKELAEVDNFTKYQYDVDIDEMFWKYFRDYMENERR